jgi:lysophospholipase L1-like esterase
VVRIVSRPAAARSLLALAAAALVGALGLLGSTAEASVASPGFPPERPTRVLVLGDSVMLGAASQDTAALPGRDVVVDAAVNRSTGQGAARLDELGTDWDVVVVMLGHNDGSNPGAYQPAARQILDRLHDVPSVVWLTIHEVRPYYPDVNAFIAGLQETYPNLSIGDWNRVASANPDTMSSDGLHLKPEGADLMARLVGDQVRGAELLAAVPSTTTTTAAPPTTTSAAAPAEPADQPETTSTQVLALSADPPPGDRTDGAGDGDPPVAGLAAVGVAIVALAGALLALRSRPGTAPSDADLAG